MKTADKKNNFLSLDKKYSSLENSKAVVIPVIYSENRKAKLSVLNAPKEIIKASAKLEHYDEEMGYELCFEKGICTLEPLNLQKLTYTKACEKLEKKIFTLLEKNKTIAMVGASHAVTLGAVKAFSAKYDSLSLLHIDSRANLKQEWQSKSHHDSLIARAAGLNINIIQVGIRSQSKEENDFRVEKQIYQYLACEIKLGMYGSNWQELVNKDLSDKVYITIDLSGFDPSVIKAVENPEPGGLLWDELMYLFKIIGMDRTIVGFDIMNIMPNSTSSSSNYLAAKLIYKILNFALSKN
ncbi:MAG: agmatinase [Ignavibacteria bacterium]|nr:MAG: agmatinase [Ignavibacteria bacterium]KAF0161052.1 MAG: agmatinase [Ignavibacteria bacterium]